MKNQRISWQVLNISHDCALEYKIIVFVDNQHLANLRVSRMFLDWGMFNRKYQNLPF
jgi:hypothetical protein